MCYPVGICSESQRSLRLDSTISTKWALLTGVETEKLWAPDSKAKTVIHNDKGSRDSTLWDFLGLSYKI